MYVTVHVYTRKTRPCLTGHPVYNPVRENTLNKMIKRIHFKDGRQSYFLNVTLFDDSSYIKIKVWNVPIKEYTIYSEAY